MDDRLGFCILCTHSASWYFRILERIVLDLHGIRESERRNVSTDVPSAYDRGVGQQLAEARAREAATNEILSIIRVSREDEQPVFDAILERATRLCSTPNAILVMGKRGDAVQTLVADRGIVPKVTQYYRNGEVPMNPKDSLAAEAIVEEKTVHVHDMAQTEAYRAGHKRFLISVDQQGIRTILFVPLVASDGGIGCLILWKTRIDPFDDDQVRLIETFAGQAVIAIENARQFRALEALNASLERRVQEQVSEIGRIGRLKRFLSPAVVDAVVTSGHERMLSSHRAMIATLFCDIRGFTAFCETAEPEETIEVLQTYHAKWVSSSSRMAVVSISGWAMGSWLFSMIHCRVRTPPVMPCASPSPCVGAWQKLVRIGLVWAIVWDLASVSRLATRPWEWWDRRVAMTTRRQAPP